MKKLIVAVLAGFLSMSVAAYAGESAKSDTGMAKSEKGMDKKGDATTKEDDMKKKAKGKKDETPK
jgi:hypothetical protein